MVLQQQRLPFEQKEPGRGQSAGSIRLRQLLADNLDFHAQGDGWAGHQFHAFPAKFPPQLPLKFIKGLTHPGDVVLDPMMGSGTTVLEAWLAGRRALGFDIDPLALRIVTVKVTPLDGQQVLQTASMIVTQAQDAIVTRPSELQAHLTRQWDAETRAFVDYWFSVETQIELCALLEAIGQIADPALRAFFELAFSAIIITKSGGVSLALDLAHTRPHRAKLVLNRDGSVVTGDPALQNGSARHKILTKTLRSPLAEFTKRVQQNARGLLSADEQRYMPKIEQGNVQELPLANNMVDLIVTSPPYASNAIDYMRAHKFSLVWSGYSIGELGSRRGEYIGGESIKQHCFESLPAHTHSIVNALATLDKKKGLVLHRYYSEMTRALREMFRVLKPGKAAVVVVGNSLMRNLDTETPTCLAEIGRAIGFEVPGIGIRQLERDRRMLPAATTRNHTSQIQQRMHEEYVIGFCKPEEIEGEEGGSEEARE